MTSLGRLAFFTAIPVAVIAAVAAVIVWPSGRDLQGIEREMDALRRTARHSETARERLPVLADRLRAARERLRGVARFVPETPDVERLLAALEASVAGEEVYGPTVTMGEPTAAGPGLSERAVPVNLDLDGSFDAVFAMIRAAESMHELVRVAAVQIEADHAFEDEDSGPPTATASIALELIYEPAVSGDPGDSIADGDSGPAPGPTVGAKDTTR